MAKRTYPLAEGGPKRLELRWKWNFSDLRVVLDGQEIGGPFDKSELERQVFVTLPGGGVLGILLQREWADVDLHVNLDGKPLPGSASDPATQLVSAYVAIFFIAAVNILLGIGALAAGWTPLLELGGGVGSIVYGAIFLALGWFVYTQHSRLALGIALALFVVDSVIVVISTFGETGAHLIVMRVVLSLFMWRGFAAIAELRSYSLPMSAMSSADNSTSSIERSSRM